MPVYRGPDNAEAYAPPGSFIDTRQFESVEALAAHLKFLDEHPEEYLKFFEWKKKPYKPPPAMQLKKPYHSNNAACAACQYVRKCVRGCENVEENAVSCGDPRQIRL